MKTESVWAEPKKIYEHPTAEAVCPVSECILTGSGGFAGEELELPIPTEVV